MDHYKFVAVVLVYRNIDDLKECIDSIHEKIDDCKVIVVNSYFDEASKESIRSIAEDNACSFISVENKGYSYGNNRGIEIAKSNYEFEYIIISNPDITIEKFDEKCIDEHKEFDIIAPRIITRTGRLQNPMTITRSRISERLEYYGFQKNRKIYLAAGIGLGKIKRSLASFKHRKGTMPYEIYAAHGSFVILSKRIINKLYPVYDENLFLFAEEGVLAVKSHEGGFKTGQFDSIIIHHKEDGSMKLSNISVNDELKKANIYYYENYVIGK